MWGGRSRSSARRNSSSVTPSSPECAESVREPLLRPDVHPDDQVAQLEPRQHIVAGNHVAEYCISAVEIGTVRERDVDLTVRARRIAHGRHSDGAARVGPLPGVFDSAAWRPPRGPRPGTPLAL